MPVRAIVLTGFGINCDGETARAFERSGAEVRRVHLNDLIAEPRLLADSAILAVPGGFSFGDDIASGRVLANRLRYRLGNELRRFIADGKLVIGVCNGFQVLVKMGLLPDAEGGMTQTVTLTHNSSARFEDRWVLLAVDPSTPCVWLRGIESLMLPVRHGEGKFLVEDTALLTAMRHDGRTALRYALPDRALTGGAFAGGAYPANPNGSMDDVAGLCDVTGRVFGLMPHPEAYVDATNHPAWTRGGSPEGDGDGLRIFRNAVEFAKNEI